MKNTRYKMKNHNIHAHITDQHGDHILFVSPEIKGSHYMNRAVFEKLFERDLPVKSALPKEYIKLYCGADGWYANFYLKNGAPSLARRNGVNATHSIDTGYPPDTPADVVYAVLEIRYPNCDVIHEECYLND